MKSDEELKKAFELYIGTEGILHLDFLAFQEDIEDQNRIAELVDAEGDAIFAKDTSKSYNCLVGLSRIDKFKPIPSKTQERYVNMLSKKQVRKVAFAGLGPFYRTLAYFMTKLSGKITKVGFFDSEKEALSWLKEE